MEAAIVLAGLIATASLVGLVWTWLQVAVVRVARLEARMLAPSEVPLSSLPSSAVWAVDAPRRDEYAPDAVLDAAADAEWMRNFQPPDGWRQ